ncbi:MAG: PA2778 family cysteine peptidase, partial [Burkholderiales bacterium]|nr:PA2778 family cysteine peptidase [Burkholderiales bacterium]
MRVCIVLAVLMVLGGCAQHGPILAPRINAVAAPTRVELDDVPFFPQRDYQCGPAALATVLTYADQPTTPDELVPAVYLPGRKGSLQVEMVAATRNHGRIGYVLAPTLAALLEELQAGRPVVVLQNLGLESVPIWHFAVVVGYSSVDETFILRSGTERRRVMPALKFMRSWVLGQQWAFVPLKPGELPAGDDADRYL